MHAIKVVLDTVVDGQLIVVFFFDHFDVMCGPTTTPAAVLVVLACILCDYSN